MQIDSFPYSRLSSVQDCQQHVNWKAEISLATWLAKIFAKICVIREINLKSFPCVKLREFESFVKVIIGRELRELRKEKRLS